MQKVTECLIFFERSYCVFAPQGFVTKCFLIFIVDEVKNFAANNIFFKLVSHASLVSHVLGSVQKGGVYILKSSKVLKWQKVSTVSSSTGIVESRDKGFVLYLKFLFIIVDCFSGRFPPRFFYYEISLFHWFSQVIISCLIYYSAVHDIDMILMFFVLTRFIHNKSN